MEDDILLQFFLDPSRPYASCKIAPQSTVNCTLPAIFFLLISFDQRVRNWHCNVRFIYFFSKTNFYYNSQQDSRDSSPKPSSDMLDSLCPNCSEHLS